MSSEIDTIQLGKWTTGFDHKSKQAVVIMEFSDRPKLALMVPVDQLQALGQALINLNQEGVSSPARPN